jgi:hypothetical protein
VTVHSRCPRQRRHLGVAPQCAAGLAQAAQKALVQAVHVDIARALVQKTVDDAVLEHRHQRPQSGRVQAAGRRACRSASA